MAVRVRVAPGGRRLASERGMSLVEAIVALFLAALLFAALSAAVIGAIRALNVARQNQTAVDVANARVEQLRQLSWGELGIKSSSININCTDSELHLNCDASPTFVDPATDPPTNRELVVAAVGGVELSDTEGVNNTTYSVATYVTAPTGATGYRLVTVIVKWQDYGTDRDKRVDTAISESTRGLALPDFAAAVSAGQNATQTAGPGTTAQWSFSITNNGGPETLNITATEEDFGNFKFQPDWYYIDRNGDNQFNEADDTKLTDTTGDTKVDTGRLDPDQTITVFAVYEVPDDPGLAVGNYTTTVTVSSAREPDSSPQSFVLTLVVPDPNPPIPPPSSVCVDADPKPLPSDANGYTKYSMFLHNSWASSWPGPSPTEDYVEDGTPALKPMEMNTSPVAIPEAWSLPPYSTDLHPPNTDPPAVDPIRGRLLSDGGDPDPSKKTAAYVADFRSTSVARKYTNSIVLRTYVRKAPGSSAEDVSLSARLYEYRSNGNKSTPLLSVETELLSPFECAEGLWQAISFEFEIPPGETLTLDNNYALSMWIWNSGDGWARIAYDHEGFPSSLTVVEQ